MDSHCVDGGFTSNSQADREFAIWRALRSIDIANALGADKIVLWLAREGTLCAEAKSAVRATRQLIDAIDVMLDYDKGVKILIEPKPNEPIDRSFCGTMGHVMGISAATKDPARVGGLLESAHAVLAGLDPANEIGFAMAMGKLWGVHLNDQNGLKFDQDAPSALKTCARRSTKSNFWWKTAMAQTANTWASTSRRCEPTDTEHGWMHLTNSLKNLQNARGKSRPVRLRL